MSFPSTSFESGDDTAALTADLPEDTPPSHSNDHSSSMRQESINQSNPKAKTTQPLTPCRAEADEKQIALLTTRTLSESKEQVVMKGEEDVVDIMPPHTPLEEFLDHAGERSKRKLTSDFTDATQQSSDVEAQLESEDKSEQLGFRRSCCRCSCVSRWFLSILVIFLILLSVLLIGARIERHKVSRAESTAYLYESSSVCALNGDGGASIYPSAQKARDDGQKVAHCGSCGKCSTVKDMEIMGRTKDTLTRDSTLCALFTLLGSKRLVSKCMHRRVGFTEHCTQCWTENMQCTFRRCKFTCLRSKLFGESNNNGSGGLNSCLLCDEKLCGPQFLACSGANRRRMGVVSDIARDHQNEQCKESDFDWESV